MIPGSGADSELAALLASRRRTSKTAADDDGQNGTSGAAELGQTTTTTSGTGVSVAPAASPGRPGASAVSLAAVEEANLHGTRDVPAPVAEEGDAVFAEARRKLRPVAGSMAGLPSVSAAAAAAAAAVAIITPDQTPKRAAPQLDDIRGWNEGSSSCPSTSMHNNATSHDNADIVAGGLVDDNIEIKTTVLQPNPTQQSHSMLHEVAIGDNAAATSNHGAGGNAHDILVSPASKGEPEEDRTAPTHTASRRDSASSGTSSARPKTPARVNKTSPTRDVSSSASRRLRASPRYQRYLAKNRSDAAATKHDAAVPATTKPTGEISSSSSEEGEGSSQDNTFQNVAKADDRTLMSPPRDSLRPFSRLERLGFDADHPAHTHSVQNNARMCENNLPFSRQASPVVAENPIQDFPSPAGDDTDVFEGNTHSVESDADMPLSRQASPVVAENPIQDFPSPAGDDTDVFEENTHSVQSNAGVSFSRQASPVIAENPIEDFTSTAEDDTDIFGGNELDDIIARACGNPSLYVADTVRPSAPPGGGVITNTTEEGHNYPHLQDADDGGYLSDMVSISDATVKQGNTIDDQAGGGDSMQTTPRRRTSKGSAFTPSPRRSPAPRVPRKGELSPTARLVRLEVENGKLRNQVSRLTTEVGIKEAIIADLKQRLNDLKPNEGHRVEAKSLKRVLQKERDFVPLNVLHEPLDPKFLC